MATKPPQVAIIGAGVFVKTQYLPRLSEISDLFHLKAIWSRTQVLLPCNFFTSMLSLANKINKNPYWLLNCVSFFLFRRKESARAAVEIAHKNFAGVECKWGDEGLDDIIRDASITAVAVVLAGQNQVSLSFFFFFSSIGG